MSKKCLKRRYHHESGINIKDEKIPRKQFCRSNAPEPSVRNKKARPVSVPPAVRDDTGSIRDFFADFSNLSGSATASMQINKSNPVGIPMTSAMITPLYFCPKENLYINYSQCETKGSTDSTRPTRPDSEPFNSTAVQSKIARPASVPPAVKSETDRPTSNSPTVNYYSLASNIFLIEALDQQSKNIDRTKIVQQMILSEVKTEWEKYGTRPSIDMEKLEQQIYHDSFLKGGSVYSDKMLDLLRLISSVLFYYHAWFCKKERCEHQDCSRTRSVLSHLQICTMEKDCMIKNCSYTRLMIHYFKQLEQEYPMDDGNKRTQNASECKQEPEDYD